MFARERGEPVRGRYTIVVEEDQQNTSRDRAAAITRRGGSAVRTADRLQVKTGPKVSKKRLKRVLATVIDYHYFKSVFRLRSAYGSEASR
jgi:hypothetical protein